MSVTVANGSITAANSASTWIANTARSAGNTVVAGATKVADLVRAGFQALAQYASIAAGHARNYANTAMNAIKANPQIAVGALAVVLATAAVYAYTQRAANPA